MSVNQLHGTGTVTGLNNYYTVSVREVQSPNLTCFNCGLDPAPQLNALRACGALTVTPGGCALPYAYTTADPDAVSRISGEARPE